MANNGMAPLSVAAAALSGCGTTTTTTTTSRAGNPFGSMSANAGRGALNRCRRWCARRVSLRSLRPLPTNVLAGGWRYVAIQKKMQGRDVQTDFSGPLLGLTARF